MYPVVSLPNTEIRTLHSSVVDQKYKLLIAFPPSYDQADEAFPVFYMLDAYPEAFAAVKGMLERFSRMASFPKILLVGITYPVNTMSEIEILRVRDFTPTIDHEVLNKLVSAKPTTKYPHMGGAGAFLRCIREEIKPFIKNNYRINAIESTLSGFSFGGLFALYTLFHFPETFNRYIIGSPTIWWDNGIAYSYEKDYATHNVDLNARVFMSMGSLEASRFQEHIPKFGDLLKQRNYPSLDLQTYTFDNEDHASVAPASVIRGMREVYKAFSS